MTDEVDNESLISERYFKPTEKQTKEDKAIEKVHDILTNYNLTKDEKLHRIYLVVKEHQYRY